MRKHLITLLLLVFCLIVPVGVNYGALRQDAVAAPPKLVVVVVMDQFRADYLTRYAPYFSDGGFKWLMRNGANLTNAHYSHATTYTGPGHALILSGTYGHTNGIIGNRWYNRATKRTESMFFDPEAQLVSGKTVADPTGIIAPGFRDDDTSPRNFIGTNLSDQLLLSNNFKSKAIGISLKDRAAIMLAGKLGKAYWFREGTGSFVSSTHYMQDLPPWVKEFNARRIPDAYFGKQWTKLLPEAAYSISHADNFANETDFMGLGKTFPHTLSDKSGKPTAEYYEGFTATPFANDYQLEFARLAIEREGLGADVYPDILGVSITSTDIAGHAYGPDSHEVQDLILRTDRQLATFFNYLNRRFRNGEVLIALTADHGASPTPEHMTALGIEAGRIKKKQLSDVIEPALTARFGAPANNAKWIAVLEDPGVFLNHEVIAEKKLNASEVERVAGEASLGVQGIMAYYTRSQFLSGQLPPNRWAAYFEKSFYPARSGDVLLATKPFYFWGKYGEADTGSTHGSPFEYDTHVPMIFNGPGVRAGYYNFRADMTDFAPTLASLLSITAPAGNEGRSLHEIIP